MSTSLTDGSNEPVYDVFDIEPTYGPTSLGGNNQIMRVHFHVSGIRDQYVDIPVAQFNAANVAQRIQELVTHLLDVQALQGPAL